MSENEIRLRLYIRLVALESGNLAADAKRAHKMVEALLAAPALAAATRAKVGDKAVKVAADKRPDLAATGQKARVSYFDFPNPKRGAIAEIAIGDTEIDISAVVERAEMKKHRATALDDLVAASVRAIAVWQDIAVVRQGFIKLEYASGFPKYARMRKPRSNARYPERSLVTFLDRRNAAWVEDVKPLLEPPPSHATVTNHGDVVEVRWAEKLDDAEIAQASTWHDCWIRRTQTTLDSQYNELGDELANIGNASQEPPLTLYNPYQKFGFKAVLVTPEGTFEESAWADALSVLKDKALPNGAEVSKLWIVVPLREHAIAVHDRVTAAGFESSVYPGNDGRFWDPVPKGPWLSESTDNGADRS